MPARTLVRKVVLAAVVATALGAVAAPAHAAGGHGQMVTAAAECATVTVTATPKLNTAMIPETIKSAVANCAAAAETVTLVQTIAGPFGPRAASKTWTITVPAGQTVVKIRSRPYVCCGTYHVADSVNTASGQQLAKSRTSYTFA